MLLRRVLCTAVILFSLALLHWPQFAHSVIIVEDNNLSIPNDSNATYTPKDRNLNINGGSALNLTLATSEPALSIIMKFGEGVDSTVRIVSAEFWQDVSKANCTWKITTKRANNVKNYCSMKFAVTWIGVESDVAYEASALRGPVSVRVDVPPKKINITTKDMQITSGQQAAGMKEEVLKSLNKCKEIRPKRYNQSIQNATPPNPSKVTYVWEIAVMKEKESSAPVVLILPRNVTLVRLDPDLPTTTAPATTKRTADATTAQTTTPGSGKEPLSAAVIGSIAGGVVVFLVLVSVAIVLAVICIRRRRAQPAKMKPFDDQPPPEEQPPTEERPHLDVQTNGKKEPSDAARKDNIDCSRKESQKPTEQKEPTVFRVERNEDVRVSIHGSHGSRTTVTHVERTRFNNGNMQTEEAEKAEPAAKNEKV